MLADSICWKAKYAVNYPMEEFQEIFSPLNNLLNGFSSLYVIYVHTYIFFFFVCIFFSQCSGLSLSKSILMSSLESCPFLSPLSSVLCSLSSWHNHSQRRVESADIDIVASCRWCWVLIRMRYEYQCRWHRIHLNRH